MQFRLLKSHVFKNPYCNMSALNYSYDFISCDGKRCIKKNVNCCYLGIVTPKLAYYETIYTIKTPY